MHDRDYMNTNHYAAVSGGRHTSAAVTAVSSVSLNARDHGVAWASNRSVDGTTLDAVADARRAIDEWLGVPPAK